MNFLKTFFCFNPQLQHNADDFYARSNEKVESVVETLQGLSMSTTSLVKSSNQESGNPAGFVTIPDVERQFTLARNSTGALVIAYMPIVQSMYYNSWVVYAEENKGWIEEANDTDEEAVISQYIWKYEGETKDPVFPTDRQYFSPVWTLSPVPLPNDAEIINYNLLDRSVYAEAVDHVSETRRPVILDVGDQSTWFGIEINSDILQTVVAFPVFADFEAKSDVVGMIAAVIPWEEFFRDIFIDGTEKISVIMSSTCNEDFTYNIDGSNASLVGIGDLHETKYDDMAIQAPFATLYNPQDETGDHCIYTMTIYPTASFEVEYTTGTPLLFCLATVAIFVFAIIVFLIFESLVQKRQRDLANAARKHMAIVSSLFPKKIRKKLLNESSARNMKNKSGKAGLRTYLSKESGRVNDKTSKEEKSKPIADLFPETTIMFADIAGFTACKCNISV
jgi:hypothetical protein